MHNCKGTRIKTGESIKLVKKLSDTFFYRLAVCLLYVLYDRSEFINASALDYVHGIHRCKSPHWFDHRHRCELINTALIRHDRIPTANFLRTPITKKRPLVPRPSFVEAEL